MALNSRQAYAKLLRIRGQNYLQPIPNLEKLSVDDH